MLYKHSSLDGPMVYERTYGLSSNGIVVWRQGALGVPVLHRDVHAAG